MPVGLNKYSILYGRERFGETEYISGSGSAVDYNKDYIPYLKDVIKTNKFKTVVTSDADR